MTCLLKTLLLLCLIALVHGQPSQVHTAWTGVPNELVITWTNFNLDTLSEKPYVQLLPSNKVTYGKNFKFASELFYNAAINTVVLQNLKQGESYTYKVGTKSAMSDTFKFTFKQSNITYAVYGDMGFTNERSIKQLVSEVSVNAFDAVLHVGDFAYNLESEFGRVGDEFMKSIEPIASAVPYMTCPGNHEAYKNFTHYKNRFDNMNPVGASSGSDTTLWYSWNEGLAHFIAIDTEVYHYSVDQGQISRQINWLKQDLIKANNNRNKYPWIIMVGHKGWWMDNTNWSEFTALSHEYGVDLYLCGHQHNYQRLYPEYKGDVQKMPLSIYNNPKYMVTIVSGSPGCPEYIDKGTAPSNTVATSFFQYGFGHMKVFNSTHLHWRWEMTSEAKEGLEKRLARDATDAEWKDDLWLIQQQHGKRQ